ncbi:MAG: hypothetical protein LBE02_02310 [Spirochaetaceae bacterium]|jgi:hypothetical protein|nr:hypothetical protein [Spirochaetaceae bacterium]
MKRLSAALVFGLLIVSFGFAQIQRGNASYNPSKTGFTISHPSLSFNTHVKVTNLENNRFVEAVVNGRIPISAERIADISREAGDSLGINKNGMTLVQLETLPPRSAGSAAPGAAQDTQASDSQQAASALAVPQTQILPMQTVTEYVPFAAQPCCNARLLWVIFLLLLLIIAILVAILILLYRRIPLWPWYYPLWIRRRLRYLKRTGRRLR